METERTAAYDPNNKDDLTQRAWALAWDDFVKTKPMPFNTAKLVFENMVHNRQDNLIKLHFPGMKIPERLPVWGGDIWSMYAFNALAVHYKRFFFDKEFTREEKERYEAYYNRMVRSFGHESLFFFPLGAHQLTLEKEYMDAQKAELPKTYKPMEHLEDAYTDEEYAFASTVTDLKLSGYTVLLDHHNVLTVDGPRKKIIRVPEQDVENYFQALDYNKTVLFDDLLQSAQEAVSTVYNGTKIDGSYW